MRRDKACFPACLQVINSLHPEVGNRARRSYNMVWLEMEEYSLTFSIINYKDLVRMLLAASSDSIFLGSMTKTAAHYCGTLE